MSEMPAMDCMARLRGVAVITKARPGWLGQEGLGEGRMSAVSVLSDEDFEKVILRAKRKDDLGLKISQAMSLIKQQLDALE